MTRQQESFATCSVSDTSDARWVFISLAMITVLGRIG